MAVFTFVAVPGWAFTVDVTLGAAGSFSPGSSFNESRAADVTVLGPDVDVLSMSLRGFTIGPSSGTVGARIYESGTGILLGASDSIVMAGSDQSVTIPISVCLSSGSDYRITFFIGGGGGSGGVFDPDPPAVGGTPYVESTGLLRINGGYQNPSDAFPTNVNFFVPNMTLEVTPTSIDVTSGTTGTVSLISSFNETRAADVTIIGPDVEVRSMSLKEFTISAPSSTVRARIYETGTSTLIASNEVSVAVGANQSIAIPMSATLSSGASYRLAFFIGGGGGSGGVFDPDPPGVSGFPYVDATGFLRINQGYQITTDSFPTNVNIYVPRITVNELVQAQNWIPFDVNGDGAVDVTDPISLLNYLFGGGPLPPCLAATDFNGDGAYDISDAVGALSFLFLGGGPPFPGGIDCRCYPGCPTNPGC
jgi:hypothetical protein